MTKSNRLATTLTAVSLVAIVTACAVNGRSAQQIVTDALDGLLASMPELESMAERAPRKRSEG